MSSKAPQGFTFFPADFMCALSAENPATTGVYMKLLCHQFINGSVPINAHGKLCLIAGVSGEIESLIDWDFISSKFPKGVNPKLSEITAYHKNKREKMSENAKKRWSKSSKNLNESSKGDAEAMQLHSKCNASKIVDSRYKIVDSIDIDTVIKYCSKSAIYVNPHKFFTYYSDLGWYDKNGKDVCKSWKSCAQDWNERNVRKGLGVYVEPHPKKRKMNVASQLKQNERGDDRMIICK